MLFNNLMGGTGEKGRKIGAVIDRFVGTVVAGEKGGEVGEKIGEGLGHIVER